MLDAVRAAVLAIAELLVSDDAQPHTAAGRCACTTYQLVSLAKTPLQALVSQCAMAPLNCVCSIKSASQCDDCRPTLWRRESGNVIIQHLSVYTFELTGCLNTPCYVTVLRTPEAAGLAEAGTTRAQLRAALNRCMAAVPTVHLDLGFVGIHHTLRLQA